MSADAREQLPRREGLHEVVIRSGFETFEYRLLTDARGEEQDGDRLRSGVCSERPQKSNAVHARHHHIAEHQIGRTGESGGESGLAVADDLDFPVRLEKSREVLAHVGVVIGNQDSAPLTSHGLGRRDVRDLRPLRCLRCAIRGSEPLASFQHGRVHAGRAERGVLRKCDLVLWQMI